MTTNEALSNFRNARKYIFPLPIHEQIVEINKMIEHQSNYNRSRVIVKQQYALLKQFKDFKRSITAYHLQRLCDNPLDENLRHIPPLKLIAEVTICIFY